MARLTPTTLDKLSCLGTNEEQFLFDDEVLEIICYLMDVLRESRSSDNCQKIKPVYDTLVDALVHAKIAGYRVNSVPGKLNC